MKIDYTKQIENFIEKLKEDKEIIAVFYTGSTANKSWDKYSDIDICVVIDDVNYNKFLLKIPKLLSFWGKINLINNYQGIDETYAYINDEFLKVELEPIKKSELIPRLKFKNIRIEYDLEGNLTIINKISQNLKKEEINKNEIIWFFLETRSNLIYSVRHYSRGQKLSGVSELGNIGGQLFYYLGKIRGYEGHEFIRAAEKLLTEKEWKFLRESRCNTLDKKEVKRTILVLWDYMKYLEELYEEDNKLNLKVDDNKILNHILNTLK